MIEVDPALEADLAYCAPLGIPLSAFQGRLAPRPGIDLEWTDQDRTLALAWSQRRDTSCGGCGTRPQEWDGDRNAYTWVSRLCPGCQVLEQGREQVPEHARSYVHLGLLPPAMVPDDDEGIPA